MDNPAPREFERPRSVAEIIGEALDIYQRYPLLFLVLALMVIAPYELVVLAITGHGPLADPGKHAVAQSYLLLLIETAVVTPLVSALHVHAVARIGEGTEPRFVQVTLRALQVLPVVVAAVLVATAGTALGLIALIIPGVLLFLRWSVVAQVAALEHEGWIPSLSRSQQLTRGHYWHIFGLLILIGLVGGGINLAADSIPLGSASGAASVAAGIAVRTITASLSALTLALLYFDLRGRAAQQPTRT
jgi:hypothetical protein